MMKAGRRNEKLGMCIRKNITNVLMIGAPRSGTMLLAGLLSAGKEASPMLPESTYFTQIIQHCHSFPHYSDPQRFAAYAIDEPIPWRHVSRNG